MEHRRMADNQFFEPAQLGGAGAAAATTDERVSSFLRNVYYWMFLGLAVTAGVAWFVGTQPALMQAIGSNGIVFFGLIIAQLGLVVWLSARVSTLAPGKAAALFLLYSALNGVTFAFILLAYAATSVASAFVTTAAMFGALALYGTVTKRSLAGIGQFAFMGLVGIVIASIVGLFWQNDTLQFLISAVGVIVFTGLTAYDAQRLKEMALAPEGPPGLSYAIVGALALYLDFINLFLMILRLMGGRRE
jgi:FtsH-binding integral membrane protein